MEQPTLGMNVCRGVLDCMGEMGTKEYIVNCIIW